MGRKLTTEELEKIENLRDLLNKGDRIGAVKCPGTKRVFTFSHWDGIWLVSKSGIDDYSPLSVYSINGKKL